MTTDRRRKLILGIIPLIIPVIPLLHLYQRNTEYVLLTHIVAIGVLMAGISAVMHVILKRVYKNSAASLAGVIAAWVIFFGYGSVYLLLNEALGIRHRHLLPVTFILALLILYLLKLALKGPVSSSAAELIICVFVCILLAWNTVGTVIAHIKARRYDGYQNNLVKTEFFIDETAKAFPDIYWIHCDGMLGFDSMEKYFGDTQPEFTKFLSDKGFIVNRGANFDANRLTAHAVPMLMSPGYYDAVLESMNSGIPKEELLNIKMLYYARINNENVGAFSAKGYETILISTIGKIFPPVTSVIYDTGSGDSKMLITDSVLQKDNYDEVIKKIDSITNIESLYDLFRDSTLISAGEPIFKKPVNNFKSNVINGNRREIPAYDEEVAMIQGKDSPRSDYRGVLRGLVDSLDRPSPKFVIMNYMMAHCPFIYDENGDKHKNNPDAIESYPPQHRYAAKSIQNIVTVILEKNPNAIIILQADHGLHKVEQKDILKVFNGDQDAVYGLWNSVMSAIRIPDRFSPPVDALHPLDVSRYLINNFVGVNYDYLYYGQ